MRPINTLAKVPPSFFNEHLFHVFSKPISGHELIAKSASERISLINNSGVLQYLPPHPQRGSGTHRCILLLLKDDGKAKDMFAKPLGTDDLIIFDEIYTGRQENISL